MQPSHAVSLLVAALVMLRDPCARNKAAARLLLERAAEHAELTPVERDACRNLADDLDIERPEPMAIRTLRPAAPRPVTDWGPKRSRHLSLLPGLPIAHDMKGVCMSTATPATVSVDPTERSPRICDARKLGVSEAQMRAAGDPRDLMMRIAELGPVMALTRNEAAVHEKDVATPSASPASPSTGWRMLAESLEPC